MQVKKVLGWAAAVILTVAGMGYGLHIAYADDTGRAIPAIEVTSPSPGTIQVVWGTPGDTDTLNSFRVMWALEGESHSYSEANTDTGGNAYPPADATSYTITGLAAGDYHVKVRARYDDGSGPFKGSAVVRVAAAAEREAEDPDRSIPAIGVSSPAAGTIEVIWGAPGDTDTLNSYRVMWALEGESHSYSETNTDTGGNAYPPADATSYTITGLAAGDYHVEVRARYDDNGSGPFKDSAVVRVEGAPEPAEEPESEEQEADPCASLEIAEVGGSASNGYALWVWKGSPVDDGVCWVDFKLSYSDDYGATFTEAAVVRRGMGAKASEYRYSIATVPEMSIVSRLQVQVCAPDSDTCHHTLKSTDASLDQWYYSRIEDRTAGANTKAVLVPTNSSGGSGNAAVVGWLEIDDTETHTYRIAMTAGKTYIFDETYRKWAMMSGEWRGGEHYYLPDEFRISLYTKNSAGELVAVSGFQDQPEFGWQAIAEDDAYEDGSIDYQNFNSPFASESAEEFFTLVELVIELLENAHFFPPGQQYRHACNAEKNNLCGPGLNIYKDKGRQLRTASYVPTKSGIYYLQVTRIRDDQPVYRDSDHVAGKHGWSLLITGTDSTDQIYMPVYASAANKQGLRSALPYYEISVEARGPTLTSIRFSGDSYLDAYADQGQGGSNQFGFLPGRFEYRVGLNSATNTLTVTATAAHSDATVAFSPADADTNTAGHQINPTNHGLTTVTITVTRGSDQETYTIILSRP